MSVVRSDESALWSLRHSVASWLEAVATARAAGVVLVHPVRGDQSVADVVGNNAHDAHHHGVPSPAP